LGKAVEEAVMVAGLARLQEKARLVRRHVVTMSSVARAPHVASALSCVDVLTALYFEVARVGPDLVDDPGRDRIILSKGHASAALYACLAEAGFLDPAGLSRYAADGSVLAEHPSRGTLPGIEVTSGSLGHGLGLGVGLALSARMDRQDWRVFAVLSDGECNEGSTWEAALWAPRQGLANLTAVVDFNKFQAIGRSTEITALEPLADKWRAFGWDTCEIDGHDFSQLLPALARPTTGKPRAIVAHTIKGKGVSFMEGDLEWHYRPPSADDLRRALAELEGVG
jgi:transketolase